MKNAVKVSGNTYKLTPGEFHISFYFGTSKYGGEAMNLNGEIFQIEKAHKSRSSAKRALAKIAKSK